MTFFTIQCECESTNKGAVVLSDAFLADGSKEIINEPMQRIAYCPISFLGICESAVF